MPVNLNGIELGGASMAPSRKTSAAHGAPASQSEASPQDGQGEVSITSTAALMAQIEQSLGSQPAIDESRVAALRQAIAAGTYQIEPRRIAGALLHTEQSLSPLPLAEI